MTILRDYEFDRRCEECGVFFHEGYVVGQGEIYYCSDGCLLKNFSKEEFAEMYADGDGDSYWTIWEWLTITSGGKDIIPAVSISNKNIIEVAK